MLALLLRALSVQLVEQVAATLGVAARKVQASQMGVRAPNAIALGFSSTLIANVAA